MTGPGQQRSKAALTADIRARRRTALVVNVRSRRGRRHFPAVWRQLRAAGLDLLDLRPVADPRRLPEALAGAADSGADLIVVGGGDGTLSEATHQLAHRDVCLGVLPLGTTNNFARSLGLPLHLPARAAHPDRGQGRRRRPRPRRRAALRQPDQPGAVGAGRRARPAPAQADPRPGRLPADRAGAAAPPPAVHRLAPRHRRERRHRSGSGTDGTGGTSGGVHELVTHQLNIANGSHHAGRAIARDTGLDDRQLVVYRLGDADRLRLTLATVRQAVTGPRRSLAHTPFLTARQVWLDTDPPLQLDVDGEIRGRTPAQITLEANALRVMVRPDFPDA